VVFYRRGGAQADLEHGNGGEEWAEHTRSGVPLNPKSASCLITQLGEKRHSCPAP
jgi:hypothetical protein